MSKYTAIVLAGGSGKRMGQDTPKQYLPLAGKPLLYYPLRAFENSKVDEIVLVVAAGEEAYCRKEFVEQYHLTKVTAIVAGGAERYDSVYNGLQEATGDYVLVHDGARAFITEEIIHATMEKVEKCHACVVAVPLKDTVKEVNSAGIVEGTPDRSRLWAVQTPQAFSREKLLSSYNIIRNQSMADITDDAMIVERAGNGPVEVVRGSYENIKITTREDLLYGESILAHREGDFEAK
ncbi:MAG: 2-C-methyl-D-erythritol 4-phosphate cytidylyltransferase [Lachnospiraceae bacterium]|nr:2-C-methyl-D-erythritol 4-phosphate cytidylyltransferase [Lachnospiraceae bacterium]